MEGAKMQKTQGNLDKMQKNENMLEKILGEGAATYLRGSPAE